ncbi:MAG: PilZ domain-containing protein [Beijerinckiaceae bacterium]
MTGSASRSDRRKHARRRVFLGGQISVDNHFEPRECIIRNLTHDGARISFPAAAVLPTHFRLSIPAKDCFLRAKVVWREDDVAGLYFEGFDYGDLAATPAGAVASGPMWRN